ncbi:hypothetical protein [Pseudolysinimonas kribbensis]|nr:hypothetical protein [Pseudolysinimonas kribbensis]
MATLGVLLLGTVTATELERSSRLTLAGVAGERLDAVFAPTSPPRFYSQF